MNGVGNCYFAICTCIIPGNLSDKLTWILYGNLPGGLEVD